MRVGLRKVQELERSVLHIETTDYLLVRLPGA